jgi:dephospho-CoA kinase
MAAKSDTIIIGLTGHAGCGKGTAASYLVEKYGMRAFTFSDIIREEATKRGLLAGKDMEEEKLILSKFADKWRKETGRKGIIAESMLEKVMDKDVKAAVVDGFRSTEEVEMFRQNFEKFVLVKIDASPEKRWSRRLAQDPDSKRENFEMRDRTDIKKKGLGKVLGMADRTINNDKTKEELYRQLDDIVKKIDNNLRHA